MRAMISARYGSRLAAIGATALLTAAVFVLPAKAATDAKAVIKTYADIGLAKYEDSLTTAQALDNRNGFMWESARTVLSSSTASSVASLLTGANPSRTGIPADVFTEVAGDQIASRFAQRPRRLAGLGVAFDAPGFRVGRCFSNVGYLEGARIDPDRMAVGGGEIDGTIRNDFVEQ